MKVRKKCPFCGNTDEEEFLLGKTDTHYAFDRHYWFIVCSCGAQGPHGLTPEEADELWDKRKEE